MQGVLVPVEGIARVNARDSGNVVKILAREGQTVRKGQVLFQIDVDRAISPESSVAADVSEALERERRTLDQDIQRSREFAITQSSELGRQASFLRERIARGREAEKIYENDAKAQSALVSRVEEVVGEGYISGLQMQQLRSAAAAAQASAARQNAEVASLEQQLREIESKIAQASYESQVRINDARRQLARADAAMEKNEAERTIVIRSPEDGVVGSILVHAGRSVGIGTPLVTIVPQDPVLEAELLLRSAAIGFVQPDSPVSIQYSAYPIQKFGAHKGTVTYVSRSALTPDEIAELTGIAGATEAMYRVRVRLNSQTIRIYGQAKQLKAGMAVTADILLDKRRMYEWVFEPLYTVRNSTRTHE